MIRSVIAAGAAALTLAAPLAAARAADCRAEVEAAFEKQRTHTPGYHVEAEQFQDAGAVKISLDYVLPDRMSQKILPPHDKNAVETIAVSRWAWGNMGGGWEELQPQFAQSVVAHVSETLGKPVKAGGTFECLGKTTVDGRELIGYRSGAAPAAPAADGKEAPAVTRTVYIDPATGLPAINMVGDAKEGGKLWAKSVFSYPADLKVEAPVAAAPARPVR